MAFRGDLYALILGALHEGPLHGYQIVRRLRDTGAAGKLAEGQIYPYLHKLEEQGLVTAEWQTDTGAAPRRVYEITASGHKELDRQRGLWQKFTIGVGTLLAAEKLKEEGNV
jgi:PadR family transcriptional regulator, regulatory protein PadR